LKQKIRAKEGDRNRFRQSSKDEERRLSEHLHKFQSDINALRQMTTEVDSYANSDKEQELARINEMLSTLEQRMNQKRAELAVISPELKEIAKKIDDQELQKKLIKENLALIEIRGRIEDLQQDIGRMDEEMKAVEGFDTYVQNLETGQVRLSKLHESRAHHEGRRGGIIDQIRSLKVSISAGRNSNFLQF
jgi:chromosome segregation ATPase